MEWLDAIHVGDCRGLMRSMAAEGVRVQSIVTSPPYWGLRDYGHADQLGLEREPGLYVEALVEVFRLARELLAEDGTLWLNLGDCYATGGGRVGECPGGGKQGESWKLRGVMTPPNRLPLAGLKAKDLIGIPWRVAFALQADGWFLRSDIIWHKPNPMPESVTDRPTKAHEYLFLMARSERYYYDAAAIREGGTPRPRPDRIPINPGVAPSRKDKQRGHSRRHNGFNARWDAMSVEEQAACGRNKRSVWTLAPANFAGAHFATFPRELVEPCILAGTRGADTVFDPFMGSGTVAEVAQSLGRRFIGCELNPEYAAMFASHRSQQQGMAI